MKEIRTGDSVNRVDYLNNGEVVATIEYHSHYGGEWQWKVIVPTDGGSYVHKTERCEKGDVTERIMYETLIWEMAETIRIGAKNIDLLEKMRDKSDD